MKAGLALLAALAVAACGSGPVVPDWQAGAHQALAGYTRAYLAGRDRVAGQELALARREVARTGNATAMAAVPLPAPMMMILPPSGTRGRWAGRHTLGWAVE